MQIIQITQIIQIVKIIQIIQITQIIQIIKIIQIIQIRNLSALKCLDRKEGIDHTDHLYDTDHLAEVRGRFSLGTQSTGLSCFRHRIEMLSFGMYIPNIAGYEYLRCFRVQDRITIIVDRAGTRLEVRGGDGGGETPKCQHFRNSSRGI